MTKAQRTRLRAIILALTFATSSGVAAGQSVPLISVPFSTNAVGSGPVISLNGQSSCAISLSNIGSGLTLVPQASSDNGATWTTVSTIGGGSITGLGNFVGSVAGTGLTSFRLLITSLSSGTVSGNEVCSGAIGPAALSGSTVTAIQPTASLLNATVVFPSPQPVTGAFFQAVQPVSCATAATCPTNATLQAGSTTAVTQPTGTNLHAVLDTTSTTAVTQATASNLNAAVVGVGAAGTPSGGVVSVQGVSSGTALPVNGTVTANANGCNNQGLANTKVATVSSGGAAGFYQIVAAVGGQTVTVCQLTISGFATTSGAFSLLGGTGSNCAVTVSNNTGSIYLPTTPQTVTIGTGLQAVTTPFTVSNAVCLDAVGAAPTMSLLLVYEQH